MDQNDFQEILKLCKEIGGRYIFIENGKLEFVLMNVKEYKNLIKKTESNSERSLPLKNLSKEDLMERINKQIALWRELQKEKEVENILKEEKEKDEDDELSYYFDIKEKLDL